MNQHTDDNDLATLEARLRHKLAEADALEQRYRKALRRDLVLWIVIAAILGALVGYGVAAALIDPVTVLIPHEKGISA